MMTIKFISWLKKPAKFIWKFIIKSLNEPFVKVTCTIIAGLLGWWLGVQYQDKNWREQYSLSMKESDRKQAEEIFDEISRLMDDRHYKTVRLLSACKDNDSIKIQRFYDSLCLQLEEWNANEHRNYALIENYYGPDLTNFYIRNIQNPFVWTGNTIIHSKDLVNDKELLTSLSNQLDSIDKNIITFNNMMLNAIKQNKVGRFCRDTKD